MSTDIATLGIKVDSSEVTRADQGLDKLAETGKKAENSMSSLKAAFAALGIGALIREYGQLTDTYKSIQGRLSLVTSGTEELRLVSDKLFAVAQRSRVEFEATADLYGSLARSTKSLGTTQGELLAVTETINKALIVSGASAATAQGALTQLGQGFASGALRGDELNSVLEGTPRLAKAIADGMGVTVGQLRALGAEGKITGEAVFNALKSQKDAVEEEFAKMPLTISQSFVQLRNEILKFVGEADAGNGASAAFANGVQLLSKNLDTAVKVIEVLAVAFGIKLVAAYTAATVAALAQQAAMVGLTSKAEILGFAIGKLIKTMAFTTILGAASVAIVGFANYVADSEAAVNQANKSYDEMKQRLENAKPAANSAKTEVNGLGKDALGSIPKINSFAGKVGEAAQQLYGMARAARAARAEMLQTQLDESQANEKRLAEKTPMARNASAANFRRGDLLNNLSVIGNAAYGSAYSLLSGGRSDREAVDAYKKQVEVSLDLQRRLKEAKTAPITSEDLPTTGTPAAAATPKPKKEGKSDAQREYEQQIKHSEDYAKRLKEETSEIGKNRLEMITLTAAREAALAPTQKLKEEIVANAEALKKATIAEEVRKFKQELSDLNEQTEFENSLIGMNAKEREVANAKMQIALRLRALEREGITLSAEEIKKETDAILRNAEAKGQQQLDLEAARNMADVMREQADAIRSASDAFGDYFGKGVQGFAQMIEAQADWAAQREEIEARIEEARQRGADGDAERAMLQRQLANGEINNYANILGAAKNMFNEKSKGYKILQAAEMAFRMFQFAMSVKAMLMDSAETTSSVANSGLRAAADGVAAVVKAIASLPFPWNLVAGAATAAAIAALGVTIFGGGGGGGAATGNMGGDGSTDTSTSSAGFNSMRNYNVTNNAAGANDNNFVGASSMPTNAGSGSSGYSRNSMNMKVVVENAPPGFYLEQKSMSADEVRLIARNEVNESAPKAVARDMSNSNSQTAKAMKANFEVTPRR